MVAADDVFGSTDDTAGEVIKLATGKKDDGSVNKLIVTVVDGRVLLLITSVVVGPVELVEGMVESMDSVVETEVSGIPVEHTVMLDIFVAEDIAVEGIVILETSVELDTIIDSSHW